MSRLAAIHIFPLKSCAPLPLVEAQVTARGLANDRRWMVIDANGKLITARALPRLVLVRASPRERALHLEAPSMPPLDVPIPLPESARIATNVWDDPVTPLIANDESSAWMSEFLGQKCRLVYMDDACVRPVDPDRSRPGDVVSFADSHPMLLLSSAAVDNLNARLSTPVPALRFRPNLLVEETEPHAEDNWKKIRIGEIEFDVLGPCTRCVFTTIDFDKGAFDPSGEPLRTLAKYRRSPNGITFGQNLIPRRLGHIRVGDPVEILA